MKDFLNEIKAQGILVTFEEGKLKIKAAKGAMTPEIMAALKEKKPALMDYFETGVGKTYPLSFSQERLWFLDQYEENSNTYHMPGLLRFKGKLDREVLKQTLAEIVKRHEALRTSFITKDEENFQSINPVESIVLEEVSLNGQDLNTLIAKELERPFNLASDPLLRTILFSKNETESYLFVNMHHIITDGWSIGLLIQELVTFYAAYKNGQNAAMPPLEIQYGDYAVWQKEYLSGEVLKEKLDYWEKTLAGVEPLALPTSHPRPAKQTYRGAKYAFELSPKISAGLNRISKNNDATLYMTVLSAFSLLLSKYSNQKDIVIGTAIANRERAELEALIGFFVNTLAIRTDLSEDLSFDALVQKTKETLLNAYEHQDVPFEKIVDTLNIARDQSRSPIFQVMLVLQNTPSFSMDLPEVNVTLEELHNDVAKFDLTMTLEESEDRLKGYIEYASDLFTEAYIAQMVTHFQKLLEGIVSAEALPLSQYSILGEAEKEELLVTLNESAVPYDKEATIHRFFETQAAKTPDNIAVVYEDQTLTYAELNEKANRLAHYLLAQGISPDDLIAISMERSFDMIVSLLAVLKAGAAYVPVDPSYPQERIDYIIADSKASLVLTEGSLKAIDSSSYPGTNPETAVRSDNLAYVIYTSGSTGKPKGVMLEHRGVVNLNEWYSTTYDFNEESANLIIISFGFDAVQKNIFSILKTGGKLVLPRSEHYDAEYLAGLIEKERCTHLNCVPSAFYPMLELSPDYKEIASLRYVLVGGEASKKEILDPWLSKVQTELVNVYGPTECNDISLAYLLDKNDTSLQSIPIGRPINNVKVYILDEHLQLVPKGVPAELHIAGDAVSRGYLYQKEMTDEKFIDNPFGEGKLYKTGDLVKYLEDGNVEYLGRVDDQVKIRGFRIELGEIEQQLLLIDEIKDAVVLAKENENKQKVLVGYVTTLNNEALDNAEVQEKLKVHLPEFMVPVSFVYLDAMPFTPNGKVDKKALERLDVEMQSSREYVAPRNEREEQLAAIFEAVLKVEKVGVHDDFFELGGHSLLATQLVSKARSELEVELPLKELFNHTTVASLSEYIDSNDTASRRTPILKVSEEQRSVLSFAQERLWFIDQLSPGSSEYNLPIALTISGELNLSHVETALNKVIERHETLRTVFPSKDGEVQQQILEHSDLKVGLIDLSEEESSEAAYAKAKELAQKEAYTPFDLAEGPLLRAEVMRISPTEHVLMLNVHHIVSDGWSMGILFKEFDEMMSALAKGEDATLPALGINYVDYSVWERERLASGALDEDLAYWEEELSDFPGRLNVTRLENVTKKADENSVRTISKTVDAALVTKLNTLQKQHNWTMNQMLLSVYSALIYRYTNQDSMVIAVPNANRPTSETEEIIGFFVNTMLIKLDLDYSSSYAQITEQVKGKLLSAIDHQDAPFQNIIESIRAHDSCMDIEESVQFAFNSLPMGAPPKNSANPLNYEVFDIGVEGSKTLLTLTLSIVDDKVEISFTYKNAQLSDEKVETFLSHYHDLLASFCHDTEDLVVLAPIFNREVIAYSKVAASEIVNVYPFTQMQNDLSLQGKINFNNKYLIGLYYAVEEEMDIPAFKKAILHVLNHTDALNVQVVEYEGMNYQMQLNRPMKDAIIEIEIDENSTLEKQIPQKAAEYIDVDKGVTTKALLVYRNAVLKYVSYMSHHVTLDGLSIPTLKSLVDKTYKAYVKTGTLLPVDNPTTLDDLAYLIKIYNREQVEFWREPLSKIGDIPIFNASNLGKQRIDELLLDKETLKVLNGIKKKYKISLFVLMYTIFISVLYRIYRFQDDIVIFEPRSVKKSLKDMSLGIYTDIRPMIIKQEWFHPGVTIVELAEKIHQNQEEVTEKLSMYAQSQLIKNNNMIFGVNFVPRLREKTFKPLDHIPENEVQFTVFSGRAYSLLFTYPENIFNGIDVKEKYRLAVESMIPKEDVGILEMTFVSEEEKKEQLVDFNQTQTPYSAEKTVHQLFEAQAAKTPEQTAVVYEGERLSYAELNAKANRLARYLVETGVKADDRVAICTKRSFETTIGSLAILKAGAAYVPIDPNYPDERIEYMLEDSNTSVLLTQSNLTEQLASLHTNTLAIDDAQRFESYDESDLSVSMSSENLVYMIYTSGSTGNPKGVMVKHSGFVNLIEWYSKTFHIDTQSSTALISSLSFDLTQKNIFATLISGATLVLPKDEGFDPEYLLSTIAENGCTFLNCAPSAFYALLDASAPDYTPLQSLKYVFLGGESINLDSISAWLNSTQTTLVNSYGPTECSDVVSYYELENTHTLAGEIPIGRPVSNTALYILDEKLDLVPKGASGELHIAGVGLARGYLHQPEMTDAQFIDNPFVPGTKMYKTGDLVSYQNDGNIEYLGRIDDQVKIRGFRIELGEIENRLLQLDGIKEAVVLAKEDENHQKVLVAYYTSSADEEVNVAFVKDNLKKHLPEFMVPAAYVPVEKMPLTPNAKIDKKALLALDINVASTSVYVAPRDEEEAILASVFAEVLNVEKVGIYDNFFELGGNSILSVQVSSKSKVAGLDLKLPDIFQGQSVAGILELSKSDERYELVDLEKEAILDETLQPLAKEEKSVDKEVFITGATGFVGRYLLHELLSTSDVKVHCLVRGSSIEEGLKKLKKSMSEYALWDEAYASRINVVLGDLVAEKLGIDEEVYDMLCQKADRIYHSAVYMNNMASYDFLAEVNVDGIEKILRLACTGKQKPLEYISTVNIFHTLEIMNEDSPIEGQKHLKSDGYGATKFLAEKLILIAQERGFDINIYRLGLVTGDERIGRNDRSQWFYKLLNACVELKAVPDFKEWVLPLAPVDFVAKAVVTLATSKEENRVYHLSSPFNVRVMDLVAMYNAVSPEKIEIVPEEVFMEKVEAYHERLPVIDYMTENMKIGFKNFVEVNKNPFLHSFKTMNTLREQGVEFTTFNEALALNYFESSKFD